MADHRKPALYFSVKYPSGKTRTLSLFPAVDFPGGESAQDRYRIRDGRSWYMPGGQKYVFLDVNEAWNILLGNAAKPESQPAPDLPVPSCVRVRGADGGIVRTYTRTEPFQGVDGRWRVVCVLFSAPVLCGDIVSVEITGKTPKREPEPWRDRSGRPERRA